MAIEEGCQRDSSLNDFFHKTLDQTNYKEGTARTERRRFGRMLSYHQQSNVYSVHSRLQVTNRKYWSYPLRGTRHLRNDFFLDPDTITSIGRIAVSVSPSSCTRRIVSFWTPHCCTKYLEEWRLNAHHEVFDKTAGNSCTRHTIEPRLNSAK